MILYHYNIGLVKTFKSSVSLHVCCSNKRLQFSHWHSLFVSLLGLAHRFLDNRSNFLGCLSQHLVHVLGHWVHVTEVLESRLGRLGV